MIRVILYFHSEAFLPDLGFLPRFSEDLPGKSGSESIGASYLRDSHDNLQFA
jgi:hypothetical protein